MPEAKASFDKRAHPRVPARLTVTFMVMKEHKEIKDIRELLEKNKTSQTLDASLGGMMLEGSQGLAKGDILTLKFTLPSGSVPLSAFAEVAWVTAKGTGLRFLSMKEEDAKTLDAFLQTFPPTV